jgi:excisionase family DNA binding protein
MMELLTVREAAQQLRLSPITIRRYIASGKLAAVRIGRNVRVPERDVAQLAMQDSGRSPVGLGHKLTAESPLWELVGFIEDGPPDLAENHDKHLSAIYGDTHDK